MPSPRSKPKPNHNSDFIEFEAIGTHWHIEMQGVPAQKQTSLENMIRARIDVFEQTYSRFLPDSLVSQIASKAGTYELGVDAKEMLDLYQDLYKTSGGLVTPMIGKVLSDAGYDASYSLSSKQLSSPPGWDESMSYDFPGLTIKKPVMLDFGGFGKGHCVDIVKSLLNERQVLDFYINAGGDIAVGRVRSEIALEHPDDPSKAIGVATIDSMSLCGSAGNRRRWNSYNHILDPIKLSSPEHIKAVWVTAETTILADAMTTALYFMLPEELLSHYTFEYAIISADGSLRYSKNFPADFF